jgi:hypothetical protein
MVLGFERRASCCWASDLTLELCPQPLFWIFECGCVIYLLVFVIVNKIPEINNLREEGFILTHNFRGC